MMKKVPVLFLAADPTRTLSLDEDLRTIMEKVRAAKYRDVLAFNPCLAARADDLVQALYETPPQIVHFSGHGNEKGIMLVGADGCTPDWVSADDLRKLFSAFRDGISVVVLSACSTHAQAKVIAEVVGCAIGTPADIEDKAAIVFNAEFYRAIAWGKTVQSAYKKACGVLGLKDKDVVRPELFAGPGVDPAQMRLIRKPMPLGWMAAAVLLGATAVVLAQMPGKSVEPPPPDPLDTVADSGVDSASPTENLAAARELHRVGNYKASFPLFKRAAEAGIPEAMGFLGIAYLRGEGTGRRPDSAAHWLSLAATAGDAQGMNAYGLAFEDGFGVGQSFLHARRWYEKAASMNDAEAMRNLARLHRQGLGTVRSDSQALDWSLKAVRAGSVEAMVDAGLMYADGVDGKRDADQALGWLQRAADAGSHRAMHAVGRLHEDAKDYAQALAWYRRAAASGSPEAMNNLGVLYQNGWGVTSDRAEAIRWYRQAAQAGSRVAAGNLAALEGN